MKRFDLSIVFLGCLLVMPFGVAVAQAQSVVVGVMAGIPNDWSVDQQNERLKEWGDAGVRFIRTGIAPNDKGIEIAKLIYDHGVKIDWELRSVFYPDAQVRPYRKNFPNMYASPPLSALDPDGFRVYFQSNLDKLEAAGVQLGAFEMGNEINWAAFNGEFPVPGQGKIFSLDDLSRDPEAQQISKGFLQYLKILAVVKDVRDHSKLNQHTPILTAGLNYDLPPGPSPNPTADAVNLNATIRFLRAHGVDSLVDAYGIHTYPAANGPGQPVAAAARRKQLADNTLTECRPVGSSDGKPCWITEWGFRFNDKSCPPQDANTVKLVDEMRDNFRPYIQQRKLIGLLYYTWADENYGVFRCGSLTQTGRHAIASMQ